MTRTKNNKELKKIKASFLNRGAALLGLTIASGAKYANMKLSSLLGTNNDQKYKQYLEEQAWLIVRELEKLKGSAMKAGQMLSIYGEHFLPPQVNSILKNLQQDSRPVVWSEMQKVLKSQLGERLLDLDIDPQPIAAASLGQVYQAYCRKSGVKIALKVQYPGVDKALDSDLKALRKILLMSKLVPEGQGFEDIFKEVKMVLHYEVDYTREANTIEHYSQLLKNDSRFVVPTIYKQYSTKRILAMEHMSGVNIDSVEVMNLSQHHRNQLAASFIDLLFKEIFVWRQVQTDPHFGNYKIQVDTNRIVLLDFGAVRKFSKHYIGPFSRLVKASLEEDESAIISAGTELGFLKTKDQPEVLSRFTKLCLVAIEGFSERYASVHLNNDEVGSASYNWGTTDLMTRLTTLATNTAFAFRFRPPPREAIFLDRKMVGVFVIISKLGLIYGPRKLITSYIEQATKDYPFYVKKK